MSYATLPDLRARAGRLASAWDETTEPGDADLETFLQQVGDELDAALALHGVDLPVASTVVSRALVGVNADGALVLAIEATWPGGRGNEETAAILEAARARYEAAWAAIYAGTFVGLALAVDQDTATSGSAEASTLWTHEPGYPTFADVYEAVRNPGFAPGFARGQVF